MLLEMVGLFLLPPQTARRRDFHCLEMRESKVPGFICYSAFSSFFFFPSDLARNSLGGGQEIFRWVWIWIQFLSVFRLRNWAWRRLPKGPPHPPFLKRQLGENKDTTVFFRPLVLSTHSLRFTTFKRYNSRKVILAILFYGGVCFVWISFLGTGSWRDLVWAFLPGNIVFPLLFFHGSICLVPPSATLPPSVELDCCRIQSLNQEYF